MSERDKQIDPNQWTEKELIKHLYREVKELKHQLQKQNISDDEIKKRLSHIDLELVRINTRIETDDKAMIEGSKEPML